MLKFSFNVIFVLVPVYLFTGLDHVCVEMSSHRGTGDFLVSFAHLLISISVVLCHKFNFKMSLQGTVICVYSTLKAKILMHIREFRV